MAFYPFEQYTKNGGGGGGEGGSKNVGLGHK